MAARIIYLYENAPRPARLNPRPRARSPRAPRRVVLYGSCTRSLIRNVLISLRESAELRIRYASNGIADESHASLAAENSWMELRASGTARSVFAEMASETRTAT